MPYVRHEKRRDLKLTSVRGAHETGELNYQITMLVDKYLGSEPNYQLYNEAIGALECAKLEIYRRLVAPYETLKMWENGDVYQKREGL
jgi:uncharacterized protein DUF6899